MLFIPVKGSNGSIFFVNANHIRSIKPSKDPRSARLIFVNPQGEEESVSVQGTPSQVARLINDGIAEIEGDVMAGKGE